LTYWEAVLGGSKYSNTFVYTVIWNNFPDNKLSYWQTCYPPGYAERNGSYYSPGICPQTWDSFLIPPQTAANGTFRSVSKPVEASAACCPKGYEFVNYYGTTTLEPWFGSCSSSLRKGTVGLSTVNGSVVNSNGPLILGTINAPAMQVRWQATDSVRPLFADDPFKTAFSGSKSTSKIIALSVGMSLLLLTITIILVCTLRCRYQRRIRKTEEQRKKALEGHEDDSPKDGSHWQKSELDGALVQIHEMPGHEVQELPLETGRHEVEGSSAPLEMEGSLVQEMEGNPAVLKR
jgi:hypothetical protein